MSEELNACKALAAMVRDHGQPTVDEVRFVAHAALELGLTPEQNGEVQQILADGGDFESYISFVNNAVLRQVVFRQIVSATLLDDELEDSERQYINRTASVFGYDDSVVEDFIAWMKEGLEWEKRGSELWARMG